MIIDKITGKSKGDNDLPDEEEFEIVSGKEGTDWKKHALILTIIVLVAGLAFGLGKLSSIKSSKEPITVSSSDDRALKADSLSSGANIPSSQEVLGAQTQSTAALTQGEVVGSKSGTKYHYPWCPGAKQISDKNKIYFATIDDAKKAGYTPAANCKGLK